MTGCLAISFLREEVNHKQLCAPLLVILHPLAGLCAPHCWSLWTTIAGFLPLNQVGQYSRGVLPPNPGKASPTSERTSIVLGPCIFLNQVGQYPPNPAKLKQDTGKPFNPHGIALFKEDKYLVSADFIVPSSTVAGPIVGSNAVRVFDGKTFEYLRTVIPGTGSDGANGFMDIQWVGDVVIASSVANGQCEEEKKVPRCWPSHFSLGSDLGSLGKFPRLPWFWAERSHQQIQ